jgi:2-alkenal reductase
MNANRVLIGCVGLFVLLAFLACGAVATFYLATSFAEPVTLPGQSQIAEEMPSQPEPTAPPPVVKVPAQPEATESPAVVVTTDEERALIRLYRQANPGVVNITVQSGVGEGLLGPPQAGGSGFVWDKEGHIVTNAHLVRVGDIIDVTFYDDTTVPAEVVAVDEHSDLAVLKVDVPPDLLVPLPLGDSDAVVPGQRVVAIGNPFGRQGSMTTGIVSAVGRTIPGLTVFRIPMAIQTDAPINPGNSGGPLLNLRGEVIGVNSSIESRDRANSGVGFAIPSNIVARVVPALIRDGKYVWPWLGVRGGSLTSVQAEANGLPVTRGAYIHEVLPGGPAAQAGLRGSTGEAVVRGRPVLIGGDVIIAADGQPIRSFDDLITYISERSVGDRVRLTILRDGKEMEVSVTLEARPETLSP